MVSQAFTGFLLIVLFTALLSACTTTTTVTGIDNTPENDLSLGSLKLAGFDSIQISRMTQAIAQQEYPNIHSVLIVKNKKLVYERYFPGNDEIWGNSIGMVNHTKDSLHDVRSISKSVVSACIGIAIAQGKIKSEDQKVWDFFPEYADLNTGEKSNLTIRHLLTMSSGLEWNENIPYSDPVNSEIQMDNSADPIHYVLSRPLVATPGTTWNYNGGCTQVLAAILFKVTGMEADTFGNQYLFKPLGISTFFWTQLTAKPGRKSVPAAASGLRLRSRDMAKIGILYMQGGQWKGRQIITEQWAKNSHTPQVQRADGGGYGYQFWTWTMSVDNAAIPMAVAVGNGDQRIYFDHEHDLMIVITAGNYNLWTLKKNADALVKEYIYPSLTL
jgi:CubicO group peptidase (beta-lactamase class C family)